MSKNEQASSVVAVVAAAKTKPAPTGKNGQGSKDHRKDKPAKKPKATLLETSTSTVAFTVKCSRSVEGIKRTMNRLSAEDKATLDKAVAADKALRKSLERQLLAAGLATVSVETSLLKYSDGYQATIVKASVFHPSTVVQAA